jgi:hypothetical protein
MPRGAERQIRKGDKMKRMLSAALLLAPFQFFGIASQAAGSPYMNFTVSEVPGFADAFGSSYRVNGSGVNLDVKNNAFQNDPFAKYDITGSMFGRPLGFGNSIMSDNFGGTSGVLIDAEGIYAKFSQRIGWPELWVETRLDSKSDTRAVVVFSVLANYLPPIPGASSSGGYQPTQSFSLRQFGDMVLVEGSGLSNVRVERMPFGGQNYRYTVRGSGFGKNFDGVDKLEFETDGAFLGAGGARIRGCGMDMEIRMDNFGGPGLTVRGTAGDSNPLAAFAMAFVRYVNGGN